MSKAQKLGLGTSYLITGITLDKLLNHVELFFPRHIMSTFFER